MININKEILYEVLGYYRINDPICEFSYLMNGQDLELEDVRIKIILRILFESKSLIIKFVKESEHPIQVIESQSILSECFYSNKIRVSKRYINRFNHFTTVKNIDGYDLCITVEDDLGINELKFINERYVKELATIMANMHIVSLSNKCQIHHQTIWNIFDDQSDIMRGFQNFLKFEQDLSKINSKLFHQIVTTYHFKKEKLLSNGTNYQNQQYRVIFQPIM